MTKVDPGADKTWSSSCQCKQSHIMLSMSCIDLIMAAANYLLKKTAGPELKRQTTSENKQKTDNDPGQL